MLSPLKMSYYTLYKVLCKIHGLSNHGIGSYGWYFVYLRDYTKNLSTGVLRAFNVLIEYGQIVSRNCEFTIDNKYMKTEEMLAIIEACEVVLRYAKREWTRNAAQ